MSQLKSLDRVCPCLEVATLQADQDSGLGAKALFTGIWQKGQRAGRLTLSHDLQAQERVCWLTAFPRVFFQVVPTAGCPPRMQQQSHEFGHYDFEDLGREQQLTKPQELLVGYLSTSSPLCTTILLPSRDVPHQPRAQTHRLCFQPGV